VSEGDRISPYYDPMIAKLIVHAETRGGAISKLAGGLDEIEVWPVKTNAAFLVEALMHPVFGRGELDTGFIAGHLDELIPPAEPEDEIWNLAAGRLLDADFGPAVLPPRNDPWRALAGFRTNAESDLRVVLRHGSQTRTVDLAKPYVWAAGTASVGGESLLAFYQGQAYSFAFAGSAAGPGGGAASDGIMLSPMPGRVISVDVRQGDPVAKGQRLLTLEAMKMEHSLAAPFEGVVAELGAAEGAQVSEGTLLVRVEKGETP
jgi:3-methylcrotonyl-CoA carboxylase alpha subunit